MRSIPQSLSFCGVETKSQEKEDSPAPFSFLPPSLCRRVHFWKKWLPSLLQITSFKVFLFDFRDPLEQSFLFLNASPTGRWEKKKKKNRREDSPVRAWLNELGSDGSDERQDQLPDGKTVDRVPHFPILSKLLPANPID
jgi:hypothetical protein